MRRIARLTAADLTNLALEAPDTPMHQAVLATVEAHPLRGPDGRLDIARVRAHVESRLDRVPELRQVILRPGLLRGRPLLVDEPGFRIDEHVMSATLPTPGGEAAALAFAERELGAVMDRSRPLWAIWLLDGYAPDRFGLLVKLHHAIADGPAMVNILAQVFDLEPDAPEVSAPPWVPAPPPTGRVLLLDNLATRAGAVARAGSVLRHPLRGARRAVTSMHRMLAEYGRRSHAPKTSLNRPVGMGRRVAAVHASLAEAKTIAHRSGVKLNDVFLFVVARSIGRVLESRGETCDGIALHAGVAVSRASVREATLSGNHVGSMVVSLPLALQDPVEQLKAIAASSAIAKTEQQPELSTGVMVLMAETGVARAFIRRQQLLNVLTTNLPGPRVSSPVAMAPTAGNVTVSFAALSYESELTFSVLADAASWPDFEVLQEAMRASWQEISAWAAPDMRQAV